MRKCLNVSVCIAALALVCLRSFAQDAGTAVAVKPAPEGGDSAAVAPEPVLTPEQEMRALERERVGLIRTIRSAGDQAAQARRTAIQADPQLAALQKRLSDLERQLQETRAEMIAKMKASGLAAEGSPPAALEGMARMRQIDARMLELMKQTTPQPGQDGAGAEPAASSQAAPAAGSQAVRE